MCAKLTPWTEDSTRAVLMRDDKVNGKYHLACISTTVTRYSPRTNMCALHFLTRTDEEGPTPYHSVMQQRLHQSMYTLLEYKFGRMGKLIFLLLARWRSTCCRTQAVCGTETDVVVRYSNDARIRSRLITDQWHSTSSPRVVMNVHHTAKILTLWRVYDVCVALL